MELFKKTYRVSAETKESIETIVEKENCTETAVVENAIRYYKDYLYMQNESTFLSEDIKRTIQASNNLLEKRLNNRTNKLLSELAIQEAILCQVIARDLDVSPRALGDYRKAAVEWLQMNDRVFRLEELIHE